HPDTRQSVAVLCRISDELSCLRLRDEHSRSQQQNDKHNASYEPNRIHLVCTLHFYKKNAAQARCQSRNSFMRSARREASMRFPSVQKPNAARNDTLQRRAVVHSCIFKNQDSSFNEPKIIFSTCSLTDGW